VDLLGRSGKMEMEYEDFEEYLDREDEFGLSAQLVAQIVSDLKGLSEEQFKALMKEVKKARKQN
jgi:hypothetical protein